MLGIDPGLTATGWGVIAAHGSRLEHIAHGVIKTTPQQTDPDRLKIIHDGLLDIVRDYQTDKASIEDIFMKNNARSALRLGLARGAAILATAHSQLELTEIAARSVKQAVTGKGSADKKQIAFMVSSLLGIALKAGDASDALAIAIAGTHGTGLMLTQPKTNHLQSHQYTANPALAAAIDAALEKEQEQG